MPPINHELLRDRRDELDLSNGDLAARVGQSPGYVENIACGKDHPSRRLTYRLERALRLPKGSLAAGERTPQGDPSEPPVQPKNEPTAPPKRTEKNAGTAPQRLNERAAS